MDTARFVQVVQDVLDQVPAEFAARLDTVEILVEEALTAAYREHLELTADEVVYGYYDGVPLHEQSVFDFTPPATIVIFQQPLVEDFSDPDELRQEIRRTVLHEIAHHFGISDERLHELGAY